MNLVRKTVFLYPSTDETDITTYQKTSKLITRIQKL